MAATVFHWALCAQPAPAVPASPVVPAASPVPVVPPSPVAPPSSTDTHLAATQAALPAPVSSVAAIPTAAPASLAHEAGFDALLTAIAFGRLVNHIATQQAWAVAHAQPQPPPPPPPSLTSLQPAATTGTPLGAQALPAEATEDVAEVERIVDGQQRKATGMLERGTLREMGEVIWQAPETIEEA